MLGAILGDFCGAQYESRRSRYDGSRPLLNDGCRFTDDSILTFATAETLLGGELPGEIESLLFCVQTGIGVGVLAYGFGYFAARKKYSAEAVE